MAGQVVKQLGGNLPVTISAENWESTAEEIDDIFIGDAGETKHSVKVANCHMMSS